MTAVLPELSVSDPSASGTRVVLIAHGSPDPRHSRSVTRLAQRMSQQLSVDVVPSYLENDEPTSADLLLGPSPSAHTIVVPLLLTAGFHWLKDLPPVLAHGGTRTTLVAPPAPSIFAEAIRSLAPTADHVVLASAGSSRPEIVDRFAALAELMRATDVEVDVALNPAAVTDHTRRGSVVVPVLTADGIFADRIRSRAAESGATTTEVLGDAAAFARTLADVAGRHLPSHLPA